MTGPGTVWSLLADCTRRLDEPFRRSEIIGWFRRHHPEVYEATLGTHIQAATVNASNRAQNFSGLAGQAPLLRRVDHGLYVRAEPAEQQRIPPAVPQLAAPGSPAGASRRIPRPRMAAADRARSKTLAISPAKIIDNAIIGFMQAASTPVPGNPA